MGAVGRIAEVVHSQIDDVDGDQPDDRRHRERDEDVGHEDGRGSTGVRHLADDGCHGRS
jgi:hypothetical protein